MSETKVILYVFDALRPDYLGCYDSARSTPHIDEFAEDAAVFTNAYAQSRWTPASSGSLLTGLYPEEHQCHQFYDTLDGSTQFVTDGLPDDVHTAYFSLIPGLARHRDFDRGFDEAFDLWREGSVAPSRVQRLNDELLPWVREHRDESFFAVVWSSATHDPYPTPENPNEDVSVDGATSDPATAPLSMADEVKRRYGEAVTYGDQMFGELVDQLKESDIYEETSMILTSDHGEIFDEHARGQHANPLLRRVVETLAPSDFLMKKRLFEPGAFLGHGNVLHYDELLNIPLIVKSDTIAPGEYSELVEHVNVLPTLWDLFDRDSHDARRQSIEDVVRAGGKSYSYSSSVVKDGVTKYTAVHDGEYKLFGRGLTAPDLHGGSVDRENVAAWVKSLVFYLVVSDGTLVRTADEQIEIRNEKKRRELLSYAERVTSESVDDSDARPDRSDLDEETKRRLEDLGYR